MKTTSALGGLLAVITLSGCALFSKGDALQVRWFDPETVRPRLTSATPAGPRRARQELELGRVSSGRGLREKIAFRDAAHELGYYEDKRWTERPEVYVRRELARTLFEERGMRRAIAGGAPVLEIEILSFEELRGEPPAARIQLRALLHEAHEAILEKTITVDRPVPAGVSGFDGLVRAMAQALEAVAAEVATEAQAALAAREGVER